MIAVTEKLAWYVARSSGIVAWATVTASILWGLTLSSRLVRKRGVPAWLLDLHRFLGTLSVVFVVVHLFGLWADNFVYFGWRELFIPDALSLEDRRRRLGHRRVLLPRGDPDHVVVDAPDQTQDLARRPPHQHRPVARRPPFTRSTPGRTVTTPCCNGSCSGSTILVLQLTLFRLITARSAREVGASTGGSRRKALTGFSTG